MTDHGLVNPDENLEQIWRVGAAIHRVEDEYAHSGGVSPEACEEFEIAALHLLYDWARAQRNTQHWLDKQATEALPTSP